MANIFDNPRTHSRFRWAALGDIREGRGDLGEDMPVLVYRLMQFTMLDVLSREFGEAEADRLFRKSGHLAGMEFARNALNLRLDFDGFIAELQRALRELRIGILRMERFDADSGDLVLTVAQDLDCSGLQITNENVCTYDEGFIAGVLEAFTGNRYDMREVDCWASGDRVCRFLGRLSGGAPG